jgi:hypothetical protein
MIIGGYLADVIRAHSPKCLPAVSWPISERQSSQETPDFIGSNARLGRDPPCVLIWCRTALVLFQRAAERVFGTPPDPSSS